MREAGWMSACICDTKSMSHLLSLASGNAEGLLMLSCPAVYRPWKKLPSQSRPRDKRDCPLYRNDVIAKERGMNDAERLLYHQEHNERRFRTISSNG